MVQHKMKKKTELPVGARQKSAKRVEKIAQKKKHRKGGNIYIAPKRADAIEAAKLSTTVSRFINQRNEQSVRQVADTDVRRQPPEKKKPKE